MFPVTLLDKFRRFGRRTPKTSIADRHIGRLNHTRISSLCKTGEVDDTFCAAIYTLSLLVGMGRPQEVQNFASSGISIPQELHFILEESETLAMASLNLPR